ncbi:MAG: hypothetical protein ACRCXB_00465 [Aeromonadaceae bacterium]
MRRLTRWRVHRRKVRRANLLHGWLSQNHLHVGVGLPPRPQPQPPRPQPQPPLPASPLPCDAD